MCFLPLPKQFLDIRVAVREETQVYHIQIHQTHPEVTHHTLDIGDALSTRISEENSESKSGDKPSMSRVGLPQTQAQHILSKLLVKSPRKAPAHLV